MDRNQITSRNQGINMEKLQKFIPQPFQPLYEDSLRQIDILKKRLSKKNWIIIELTLEIARLEKIISEKI